MKTFFALLIALSALCSTFQAHAKPFRRALVIGGGGITPGVALGMIAGAQAAGYDPDVIITSCGASLGASIYNSFGNSSKALAYARSEKFYHTLKGLVRLNSWTVFPIKKSFDGIRENPELLPDFFDGTVLEVPEQVQSILPRDSFPSGAGSAKFIVLAAKAAFGPGDAGKRRGNKPLIQEVFITDPGTAEYLRGRRSTVGSAFPKGYVSTKTQAMTGVGMSQAARASITDPFYLNPARIGKRYFFGGAVDLFPLETATDLAEQVLANFPIANYADHEDLAISSVFGFRQSQRARLATKQKNVMWIDNSGASDLSMDPKVSGIFLTNKIPGTYEKFRATIDKQYKFGYARAVEAVKVQRGRVNVRSHLRYTGL